MIHTSKVAVHAARKLKTMTIPCALIALATVTSGGFVAGNDAGHAYNTWPKMLDDWVPPEVKATYSDIRQKWRDIFESTPVVQFDHRMMAYATVASSTGLWILGRSFPTAPLVQSSLRLLPLVATGQTLLGITTLLMFVPVELGTLHQAGGIIVLSAYVALLHSLRLPIKLP
jgi:cytochrome c oxidase assembly protein subunit 15